MTYYASATSRKIVNERERYHFDLEGYLLVKGLLGKTQAVDLLAATQALEDFVVPHLADPVDFVGQFNIEYRVNDDLGICFYDNMAGGGRQIIVDDFLNATSAFDCLVGHGPTMDYVREMATPPYQLASSELRIRYKHNKTLTHMGGPIDTRNRFCFANHPIHEAATGERAVRPFNLITVRVMYALHDIPLENGPLCVVPGTHKANFFSPYGEDPNHEPGMIGVPMEAGDALFFTENLRHGGLPNKLDTPRRTIHLMIGPRWAKSQSPAHWDGEVFVSEEAWERYSSAQRELLPAPRRRILNDGAALQEAMQRLQDENRRLRERLDGGRAHDRSE
jgi:hypothetical protein